MPHRPGAASIWALVVLAVVSAMSVAAVGQFAAARRQVDAHGHQIQADWLARAGYELAVARVLADPTGYTGETVTPIPAGEVKIVVRKDPDVKDVYRIESQARYPAGERGAVVQTVRRSFKRIDGPQGVRIEPAPNDP
jgi:hypothetical protein